VLEPQLVADHLGHRCAVAGQQQQVQSHRLQLPDSRLGLWTNHVRHLQAPEVFPSGGDVDIG
jgi:hypothetical protein